MANEATATDLPFQQAIDFFRQKVNLPTEAWSDLLNGAHARAFTVAGAAKEDLLVDLRGAIDQAISQGTTLEQFRGEFDAIVAARGWDYRGSRGWRTRVIYSTNLNTAYATGRYQQMTDPDVLRYQPYWIYRHSDAPAHARKEHLVWNGLVLDATDPWWKTHYPPNGWGCQCTVEPVTRRELGKMGKKAPDQAPPIDLQTRTLNTSTGPVSIEVPRGIDPGWGYNVGEAAFGRQTPEAIIAQWRQRGAKRWERLTAGDWESWGRPEVIASDTPQAELGPTAGTKAEIKSAIERAIGGSQAVMTLPNGDPILVDALALADHIPLNRSPFVPFMRELIADPFEVWLSFERDRETGLVVLRKRVVKLIHMGKKGGLLLVGQSVGGVVEAWTFIPTDNVAYLSRQRVGRLLWGRDI